MTTVKDFRVDEPATPTAVGRGAFVFTDDYSVFDWGKMPDRIPDKGASLCTMGAFNFELLERDGIPTHYRGVLVDGTERSLPGALEDGRTPREMRIDLVQVPDLPFEGETYNYDTYHDNAGSNYLVPLEVVFRNRVPVGSSLRKRSNPAEHGLSMDEWPDEPVDLPDPVVEFSTKYEKQDRYLDPEEADSIAGRADIGDLEPLARDVNRLVTKRAAKAGMDHQDGKIECLYHDGKLKVADVVGTFDENRFSYNGHQVSKEVIRQYHKRTQPDWVAAVSEAKKRANARGIADWKSLCDRRPTPLDDAVIEATRDLYTAGTNAYVGREIFEVKPLAGAVDTIHELARQS